MYAKQGGAEKLDCAMSIWFDPQAPAPRGLSTSENRGLDLICNKVVAPIHPCMSVILPEAHHAAWLGEAESNRAINISNP
jgi:hypothetical protein